MFKLQNGLLKSFPQLRKPNVESKSYS